MPQTMVEKIAQSHLMEGPARPLRAGDVVSLRPRHVLTHDNTAAVMKKFRSMGATRITDPAQPVFVLDHDIQNMSEVNLSKYREIQEFAAEHGVAFFPAGTGIGHQIMVSHGYVVPGSLVVASDSHANMYGALGAVGTPVVRTDAAAIWATGEFWWQIPRTVQVVLHGALREGVTGKDVILTLCGLYHAGEVLNAAVEFTGPGISSLSIDARLTIANMTTEWGALVGWFPVDGVTIRYLRERQARIGGSGRFDRFTDAELAEWEHDPPRPDRGAPYAGRIELDLSSVTPYVAGPDSVHLTRPVAEIEAERLRVDKAYIVSCVNSRLEDLEEAAGVLRGRQVAEGVELWVAAASREVELEAQRHGSWQALLGAGARPLPPGCGPCIGLGAGLLEDGEVGISATNRNFKGRMGSRNAQAYLASPAVVAESAAAGYIKSPVQVAGAPPEYRYEELEQPAPAEPLGAGPATTGGPGVVRGRILLVPRDDLDTDGIYGKEFTYREGMTPEEMAAVVMRNYDPEFAGIVKPGDILVGGRNFGIGSSREQAATALKAAGIALVIAGSFSQTYLRNAFNNGFICLECPSLVERLREELADEIADGRATIQVDEMLEVDLQEGVARFRGEVHRFPPLGPVQQGLVAAGGLEAQVRARLGAPGPVRSGERS